MNLEDPGRTVFHPPLSYPTLPDTKVILDE